MPVRCRSGSTATGPSANRLRKDVGAGVLVHHVERDHHHVPHLVLDGAPKHFVLGVVGGGLGDAEMAELTLRLLLQEGGAITSRACS
jgi:hypothetical protein